HMLDDDLLCDITFVAGGDKQEVRCHRFMLASRSPVFFTMFCGSLPEAAVVEIADVDADVLRMVIRFIYTREIKLMPDSVMATMYAAKKYDIQPLVNLCKTFLRKNIAVDNVCIILEQALMFEETNLIQLCLSFISKNVNRVFYSDTFLSMSSEALKLVLEKLQETTKLPAEQVYAFCKRWAEHACYTLKKEMTDQALRQTLGDLIFLVDFESMTFESFMDNVGQDNILSDEEKVKCLTVIRKRQKKEGNSRLVFIERSNEFKRCDRENHNGVSFRTSKEVMLSIINVYLPIRKCKLSDRLEVLEEQTVVLTQNLICNETYKCIHLVNEVSIHPGVIYSMRLRLTGGCTANMYFENIYQETKEDNGVEVELMGICVDNSDNEIDLNGAQLLGLTFNTI
ncbi:BTB/POZ domain-containing protein 6-like, partial [Mya arenaria]